LAHNALVGFLFDAWDDFNRAIGDVSPEDAVRPIENGSSFAWTLAHVTHTMDGWLNVRFQHLAPHPLIGDPQFRMGGTVRADDWLAIQAGVRDVRECVRLYLQDCSDTDLDLTIPYDGSITSLRQRGISLRYAIMRNTAHHFVHIGEIETKRNRLGHQIGVFPGELSEAYAAGTSARTRPFSTNTEVDHHVSR
jgi:hypothetical protein